MRTCDGVIHLGPYTRSACLRKAEAVVAGMTRAYRPPRLPGLVGRRRAAATPAAPRILVPGAFRLDPDHLCFFLDGPVAPGTALLAVPAMRRDDTDIIG